MRPKVRKRRNAICSDYSEFSVALFNRLLLPFCWYVGSCTLDWNEKRQECVWLSMVTAAPPRCTACQMIAFFSIVLHAIHIVKAPDKKKRWTE